MGITKLEVKEFLFEVRNRPLLDVRSPGEYLQGHIPGSISFPLFSNEERAKVGTRYKQVGKESAFLLGLKIVGPKMADFVKKAIRLAPDRKIAVHCWRGGQRSGSIAWLLQQAGFEVVVLNGGYKAYRQYILDSLSTITFQINVVGGKTGVGKTRVLNALSDLGEQVLDLEFLANHKGSAFGFIGELPQPTPEQFENILWDNLASLDLNRRLWVENESRSIGRVYIPEGFWKQMKLSPLFHIEIPQADRINNLLKDYVLEDTPALKIAFEKIAPKLGGLRFKQALEALDAGHFSQAAALALEYYDKTYQHCLDQNISPQIRRLDFSHGDPHQIALMLSQL
jgi:tRNA 2-selenouridine synthase